MNINEIYNIDLDATDTTAGTGEANRWLSWCRPQSFWEVACAHLPMALITGLPLLLSFLLPLNFLPLLPCTVLQFSGYPCPFCGFTRSFWAISSGNWTVALVNAPLSVFVYVIFAATFILNATALCAGIRIKPGSAWHLSSRRKRCFIAVILALFLINWVYRLSLGLK